jgi:uncharacterized protein YlbG (UPF0298 family)
MQTKVLKNLQIKTERDELFLKVKKIKVLNLIKETEISLNEKIHKSFQRNKNSVFKKG